MFTLVLLDFVNVLFVSVLLFPVKSCMSYFYQLRKQYYMHE